MKVKKFLKELNKLVKENPELLEAKVVYAIDDEGNAFHKVKTTGTVGAYVKGNFYIGEDPKNAVCIN